MLPPKAGSKMSALWSPGGGESPIKDTRPYQERFRNGFVQVLIELLNTGPLSSL